MSLSVNTKAIILRGYDAGEYDKSLVLYANGYGRVTALAKGLNSPKSKRKALVQSGNVLRAQLADFHGKQLLHEVELQLSADWFVSSSSLAGVIFHVLELIDIFAVGFENTEEIIELYEDFVSAFRKNPRLVMLRIFELKILEKLGFFPSRQLLLSYKEDTDLAELLSELVRLNFDEIDKIGYQAGEYRRIESFLHKYLEHTAERKLYSYKFFLH